MTGVFLYIWAYRSKVVDSRSIGFGHRLSLWKWFTYQNVGRSLRFRIGQNSMTWNKITGWQSWLRPFGPEKQVARQSDSIPNGIYCGWRSNDRSNDTGSLLEISRNLEFCKSSYLELNIYPIPGWYGRLFLQTNREVSELDVIVFVVRCMESVFVIF